MPYLKTALLCLDCSWINEANLDVGLMESRTECQKCNSTKLFNLSIWLDKKEKEKEKGCQQ